MRRLVRAWVLISCTTAFAQISVREPATRARLVDGKTTIALALNNSSGKPLHARVELQWLGPADEVHGFNCTTAAVAPGDSLVELALPLDGKHNPLLDRLQYQVRPAEKNYTGFPELRGILDFATVADYAFTLSIVTADLPRPGRPFELRVLATHPVTGRPVAGVEVHCGSLRATSDSSGLALLQVAAKPEEEDAEFRVEAKLGDLLQEQDTSRLRVNSGDLRIDTDKPIYQPGQTLHVRLLETGGDGRVRAESEQQLNIKDDQDETVYAATLTSSRFGIAVRPPDLA